MTRQRWAGPAALFAVVAFAAPPAVGAAAQAGPPPARPTLGSSVAQSPPATLGTAILSPRRLPGWLDLTVAHQRLAAALEKSAGAALTAAGAKACVVVTQGASTVYSYDPGSELIPASNEKILTATAALQRLGSSYRFTTQVLSAGQPEGGAVHGSLYLLGGGDPVLRTNAYQASLAPGSPYYTSLDSLAAAVRAAGVSLVTGGVVGDESRYDTQRTVPGWKQSYSEDGDVGPLSALDVNDGFAIVPMAPGAKPQPTTGPPGPAQSAAATFATLLREHGVAVEGPSSSGTTPAAAHLIAAAQSPPLADIVDGMLTVSDDTTAELLLKEVGYKATGIGSTSAGLAAERSTLAADGLPVDQMVAYDGSGLDRSDQMTCTMIADALRMTGPTSVLAGGLPVAGRTGTLAHRLVATPAAGRVRAKTGTLDNVSALSGFVSPEAPRARPGALSQPLTFSVIVNGPGVAEAVQLIDSIALTLAAYPDVPPPTELGPRP